ncbi:hypothetical protein T459_32660 [Capsicum annuum]|uniref:Uncharacterized protein n=1 Tax=Capsicum annuum TaxID=4072 RepID=A0A2G2Y1B5_CAPAN|nr:hypothetical protein T459_32660 [Capsicum annuum]
MVDELHNFLGNIIEKKEGKIVSEGGFGGQGCVGKNFEKGKNVEKESVREIREKDGRLSDMVYMHASIYESLRLFPPFPADSKEAVDDNVWPDGTKV